MNRLIAALAATLSGWVPMGAASEAAVPASVTGPAADVQAVRAVGRQWQALYRDGKFAAIPELYTKDTVVMPRGRPRIEGRDAMRRSVGGLAAGRKVDIDVTEREISVVGDLAWFISDFRVTYSGGDGNTAGRTEYGRSMILFRRDTDGRWRVHRDMDSPAPPPGVTLAAAPLPAATTPALVAATAPAGTTVPRVWDPSDRKEPTECDRLTSSRYDRTRLAKPVAREDMDVPAAIRQCEADLLRFPGDPRIHFQLGRIYGYAGNQAKTLEHRRAAAAAGNHNAIFLLGYLAWSSAKDDQARCSAARDMRLSADRGNYSGQLTVASLFLEGRLAMCRDLVTAEQVRSYLKAARPSVDGFFETRLADHLAYELERVAPAAGGAGADRD